MVLLAHPATDDGWIKIILGGGQRAGGPQNLGFGSCIGPFGAYCLNSPVHPKIASVFWFFVMLSILYMPYWLIRSVEMMIQNPGVKPVRSILSFWFWVVTIQNPHISLVWSNLFEFLVFCVIIIWYERLTQLVQVNAFGPIALAKRSTLIFTATIHRCSVRGNFSYYGCKEEVSDFSTLRTRLQMDEM